MSKVIKPRLAKGTRDFSPEDMRLRNYIIDTIRDCFELYGFEQIETPAVENLETLTGKYGDEGDKLIFKILNSGDYLKDADENLLMERNSEKLIPQVSEKALRYDLTVPFARYVVQHRNDIAFPFRRYQIQPVWRADRPQKGRYREFYQCDADVIGSDSLMVEAEFIDLLDKVFKRLNIKAHVKLNSRKVLFGFCQQNGIEAKFSDFTTILDKLDKKPWNELAEDFRQSGFSEDIIERTSKFSKISGNDFNVANISKLHDVVGKSESGKKGIEELNSIADFLAMNKPDFVKVSLDLTLARGLNYYTGAIVEVLATEHAIGSISGGGRYDDLTGIFGMPGVSGMGISFGIDRIFDVLKAQEWKGTNLSVRLMLVNFGEEVLEYNLNILRELRMAGVSAEIYPDADKLKKQFKYADQKNFTYVVMAGSEEMNKGIFSVKDLKKGSQTDVKGNELVDFIKNSD